MQTQLPEIGKLYKHFKGGIYKVLGISTPTIKKSRAGIPILHVCMYEANPKVEFLVCEGWNHIVEFEDTYIIYQNTNTNEKWARSVVSWNTPTHDGSPKFIQIKENTKVETPEELRKKRFLKEGTSNVSLREEDR